MAEDDPKPKKKKSETTGYLVAHPAGGSITAAAGRFANGEVAQLTPEEARAFHALIKPIGAEGGAE